MYKVLIFDSAGNLYLHENIHDCPKFSCKEDAKYLCKIIREVLPVNFKVEMI